MNEPMLFANTEVSIGGSGREDVAVSSFEGVSRRSMYTLVHHPTTSALWILRPIFSSFHTTWALPQQTGVHRLVQGRGLRKPEKNRILEPF